MDTRQKYQAGRNLPENKIFYSGGSLIKYSFLLTAILLLLVLPEYVFHNQEHNLCLHYKIFGYQCPLCGMLRAVYEIIHLNLSGACRYHFAVLFLPVIFLLDIAGTLTRQQAIIRSRNLIIILFFLSLLIIYFIRYLHFRTSGSILNL